MKKIAFLLVLILSLAGLGTAAVAEEPVVIRFMTTEFVNAALTSDTFTIQTLEDRLGIQLDLSTPASAPEDYAEKFNIMLSSGDYPDIMYATPELVNQYLDTGIFLDLTEIMPERMPNVYQQVQAYGALKDITDDSGKIWFVPKLEGSVAMWEIDWINQSWLDELDLEVPKTTDELYEVLKAFKAAKGDDCIPMTMGPWADKLHNFYYAFNTWSDWQMFSEETGMEYGPYDHAEEMRACLTYLNKLYSEGLLDNDWMQADKKSTQTDFVSGNCILGYAPFGQGLGNYTKAMMEADPNFKEDYIQAAAPVTSTKGKNAKFSKMNNIYDQSGASAAISSQCKNVKAAVWLLDWLYSEEGQICYNFGIEGESYEMKDGKPVYTDLIMNNPDGMSVAQALAAYTRASTSGAGIQSEDYIDQYYAQDNQKKALELSMKTDMGEHMFPPTSVSEENQDRYSEIMSQVKTLADEMEASFICGTTPMSEWDSYQQKLKDAGIEEAVQMMQEAYDTYMAN